MDRRAFLVGALASAGIAATGTIAPVLEATSITEAEAAMWSRAFAEIFAKHYEDLMLYGNSVLRYTDQYPFLEHVPLTDYYPRGI